MLGIARGWLAQLLTTGKKSGMSIKIICIIKLMDQLREFPTRINILRQREKWEPRLCACAFRPGLAAPPASLLALKKLVLLLA